jgi:ferrous iron transport protein B
MATTAGTRGSRPSGEWLVALAGQPNVGKSTIFNLLTGLSQHVGNWPGKTVERREGLFAQNGIRLRIVDLPGAYALTAHSVEERIARDFIIHERPDVVVVVADAASLERNLYLVAELVTLRVPLVLALNMMDVAHAHDVQVEPPVLEAALGVPVVAMVATRNEGTTELLAAIRRVIREPARCRPPLPEIAAPHGEVLARLRTLVREHVPRPYDSDWIALKLLEGDPDVIESAKTWLDDATWHDVHALLVQHDDALLDIAAGRYDWIGRMVRAAIRRPRLGQVSLTDRIDRVAVDPLWGFVLLLGAFAIVFWVTFLVAAPVQQWLDTAVVGRVRRWPSAALPLWPAWIVGLISDGLLAGIGIILTFLPVLIVFFTALGLLEDTGYLVRTGFVMDGCMHLIGLHGKSFLPLCLGFGCNVPAVLATRVIEAPSGRLLTILLAPLVPCSGRLTVLAFVAPAFFGGWALLVSCGLVAMNLLALGLLGTVLSRTTFRARHMAFILELPLYHVPNPRTIAAFVWRNVVAFLRNATSVILLVSIVVWAGVSFPGPDIGSSYLARAGQWLAPVGALMGLDWRLLVALVSSFVAKENAIATLGVLYGERGAEVGLAAALAEHISPASAFAFLTVMMLFVPCVATVAAMHQETRSWRWPLLSAAVLLVLALGGGTLVYQAGRWLGLGA